MFTPRRRQQAPHRRVRHTTSDGCTLTSGAAMRLGCMHALLLATGGQHRGARGRPTGRWRARLGARRDPRVGPARRAAEGGQVAAQGRAGQRAQLYYNFTRSDLNLRPAARLRYQRPAGGGEGAAEARRERRPAKQPRLHLAHGCGAERPHLRRAPPPAALGQPWPAGHRRHHCPDGGRRQRVRGVRAGPAASQGQHRAARHRAHHRPAARRRYGPNGHRGAPPAAHSGVADCRHAGEPAVSAPASVPGEILVSAGQGELQKVVKWLRKGGPVDALSSSQTVDGYATAFGLLHASATNGQLEIVRMLLKRGANVDLQNSQGYTGLSIAASYGHPSVVLLLLQHSANPDLQSSEGGTALMGAAGGGHEACVQALLQRKAKTELLDGNGRTARWWAEATGQTATAELILSTQHRRSLPLASPRSARLPPSTSPRRRLTLSRRARRAWRRPSRPSTVVEVPVGAWGCRRRRRSWRGRRWSRAISIGEACVRHKLPLYPPSRLLQRVPQLVAQRSAWLRESSLKSCELRL
eukprot:scaffold2360_cov62-Phaeocystis_antarctica.AAC.2